MAHIQWKERYNINYKEVDAQHRQLLDIMNQLMDLIESKRPPDELSVIFHRLCAYALDHFTLEERYLEACAYPDLAQEKDDHGFFVGKILAFNERYDPTDPELLREIFQFLKTWYLGHILRTDMAYVPYVRRFYREAAIRGVIVDCEGLLARSDHQAFLQVLERLTGKSRDTLERLVFEEALFTDYQTGAFGQASFLDAFSGRCGVSLGTTQWAEAFRALYTPLDEPLELFRGLQPRFKLGLVANSHPWHAEQVVCSSPAFQLFEAVALSFEVKSRVPDHRILNGVLDQLGLVSEECLFLTSCEEDALAADKQLFHGHVFQGAPGVLKALGVDRA